MSAMTRQAPQRVAVAAGVTAPALTTAAVVLLVMAGLGLLVAAGLLVLAVHRPRRSAP